LGAPELIFILVIVLILFGPKQLPKIGRALGSGIRELKDAANKLTEEEDESTAAPARKSQPSGTVPTPGASEKPGQTDSDSPVASKDDASHKMSTGSNVS